MKINSINTYYTYVNFRKSDTNSSSDNKGAILMLRDQNASVKFQKNQEYSQNADSVESNPVKALGYKLVRTFQKIRDVQDEAMANETDIDSRRWYLM